MLMLKCRLPCIIKSYSCFTTALKESKCLLKCKKVNVEHVKKSSSICGFHNKKKSSSSLYNSEYRTLVKDGHCHSRLLSNTITKDTPDINVDINAPKRSIAEQDQLDFSWKNLIQCYLNLSKIRLTGFVVLTSMAGYVLAPGEFSSSTFAFASLGTMLCSCSANTINQWLEVPFDSQMARTKNRVLVRGLLSPLHALSFGVISGVSGLALLLSQVNGLTALLGAANIMLYTLIYTPLKRLSIVNTWVGSFVGALPPLMGWAACAGTLNIGAFLLAGILYSWQFPHFNALSWSLRADYSRAGYRMTSVTNPELCRKVAFRHSISLIILTTLMPVCDVTTAWLALDALPLNLWITWLAWKFNKDSDNKSARNLFRFSLLHMPLLLLLVLYHKKDTKVDLRTCKIEEILFL